ncbi:helix-turn-helix transcriptional regulator [Nocardia sp. NPDC059239]|uniref:helix-turn-helix transcriptional regulator n=1 Tax=unclassified Nocardia TaxID=2637762 RepID=UPI0036ACC2F2
MRSSRVLDDIEQLLTYIEVAEMTRLTVGTLRYLRHEGRGPRSFKLGRQVRYSRQDVLDWIAAQRDAEEHRFVGGKA